MTLDLSRRQFFKGGLAAAGMGLLPSFPSWAANDSGTVLATGKAHQQILPENYPQTDIWSYNGNSPGPVLRTPVGREFSATLDNGLDQGSSIHWHGVRLPNDMDGVPFVTQAPVQKGQSFTYRFTPQDAGTFWYHPHMNSAEQVDRGLKGVLVVDEENAYPVDRDLVWVLDDWRLGEDGKIAEGYGDLHDAAHAGRYGNVPTVNGQYRPEIPVKNGERLRIRLVNAANARIFTPNFAGLDVWLIAFDGQPVSPSPVHDGDLVIAPGMRADIVVDIVGKQGDKLNLTNPSFRGEAFKLLTLTVGKGAVTKKGAPPSLAQNPLAAPDLENAEILDVSYEGGAMGRMAGAKLGDEVLDMRSLAQKGAIWATNGVTFAGMEMLARHQRLFDLKLGKSYIFRLANNTAWDHPIHLHGHSFKVIRQNGKDIAVPRWQDTVLIGQQQSVDVAFVADNPGDWMFHCHILDHAAAGMIAAVRVS